ncbi:MAG TPA: serine/threonine-protein kinase [Thermoanaerobaculia bacterium]
MSVPAADPFWERVRELFQQAVEADAATRDALFSACDDPRIVEEVLSLLAAHDDAGEFLAASLWEMIDGNREARLAGTTIGPYRLVRPLGEGGMGTVFLAVRDDEQFDQRVAIKLIRGGAAADSIVRRFRQERQILAALEHPNIARLIDGGTTADGLPYLVMEYVDGTPIDRYCKEQSLSVSDRLRLFLTLCDAVQYAHRNLVIHRDLKPANVLITRDGSPKLLDFGIAKLTSTATADATVTRMMTPDYASPEQLRGLPVSTSSDVYSLGVLLYELLTGSRPFDSGTRTPDAEPVRPATRMPALRGDIDNMLMMAMHPEPARRYGSVQELADDVRRHLTGHPVIARRDTIRYRASKFVRRNRIGIAAAIAIVAVIAVGFITTLRQKRIAERRFDEVRTLARAFVFDIHDAIAPLPGSTQARALLVRRALVYLDNLSAESANNTPLEMELAGAYLRIGDVQGLPYQANLGDTAGAISSYGKALAIARAVREREPSNRDALLLVADAYDRLGFVRQRTLDWVAAMREHQTALALRRALEKPTPREQVALARTWISIGDCRYIGDEKIPQQWRQWSGQEAYEHGLRVLEALPRQGDHRVGMLENLARGHQRLGGMFSNRGLIPTVGDRSVRHHDAALRALAETVQLDPSSATARRNYADQFVMKATAQVALQDGEGALAGARRGLEELERLRAGDPKNVELLHDTAFALQTMGEAYVVLQRWNEAEDAYGRALAIFESLSSNDATNRESIRGEARTHSLIATMYRTRGNAAKAAEAAERSKRRLDTIQ